MKSEKEEQDNNEKKHFAALNFTIFMTVFSLILILRFIATHFSFPINLDLIANEFVFGLQDFKPEPLERLLFLSGLFFTPILILGWYFVFYKKIYPSPQIFSNIKKLFNIRLSFIFIMILFLADFLWNVDYLAILWSYISIKWIGLLILFSIFIALDLIYWKRFVSMKLLNRVLPIVAFFVAASFPLLSVFDINNVTIKAAFSLHFNSVFHAVSQVVSGKEILFDFNHQYGLYPHFIAPLFQLIGLDVFKFTLFMGLLTLFSYYMIFLFLKQSLKNKILVYVGIFAIIFTGCFFAKPQNFYDLYFQYNPIRFLFPAASIFLTWKYFNKESSLLYYFSFVLYALSILWNVDTGSVVFLSWLLVLAYQELAQGISAGAFKRVFKHFGLGIMILILIVGLYSVSMLLIYGHFPDYGQWLGYQSIFYQTGFFMLPMELIHPWNLVILTYIAGLAFSLRTFFDKDISPIKKSVFYLSVLGFGLFSYFQGRSHSLSLIALTYPAFIIFTIFVDNLMEKHNKEGLNAPLDKILATFLTFLIFLNLCFVKQTPLVVKFLVKKFEIMVTNRPNEITQNVDFIKSNINPGDKVLILSYYSGIYYAESKADNPLMLANFSELFTKSEYEQVRRFIESTKYKIIIDSSFMKYGLTPSKLELLKTIYSTKKIIRVNPNKNIFIMF